MERVFIENISNKQEEFILLFIVWRAVIVYINDVIMLFYKQDFHTYQERGRQSMIITDEARDLLKQILVDKNSSGIRVYFAGFG